MLAVFMYRRRFALWEQYDVRLLENMVLKKEQVTVG